MCADSSIFFLFKQKTAYEMRISDWSSDVCSSDLGRQYPPGGKEKGQRQQQERAVAQQRRPIGGNGGFLSEDAGARGPRRRQDRAPPKPDERPDDGDRKSVV